MPKFHKHIHSWASSHIHLRKVGALLFMQLHKCTCKINPHNHSYIISTHMNTHTQTHLHTKPLPWVVFEEPKAKKKNKQQKQSKKQQHSREEGKEAVSAAASQVVVGGEESLPLTSSPTEVLIMQEEQQLLSQAIRVPMRAGSVLVWQVTKSICIPYTTSERQEYSIAN